MADQILNIGFDIAGVLIVAWVLWDVFQTVIVPRPTPARVRLAPLITRRAWRIWRFRAGRAMEASKRQKMLGSFAPGMVVTILSSWVLFLIIGYGFLMYGFRAEVANDPDLPTALYQAGITLLGGDVPASGEVSRIIELASAFTGLAIVALGITYLFSLYGSFQRREELVTTLDARAGAPPSGVKMLETYAKLGLWDDLRRTFAEWEVWSAQVLDTHVAYPILVFFRSSHDNESWVSALGAVLDAAVLLATTVDRGPAGQPSPTGQAVMTIKGGSHLVEDLSNFLRFDNDHTPMVERAEYDAARERLHKAGLTLRSDADASWERFVELRSSYASRLNGMAGWLLTPPTQWIGDRSMLPHRFWVESSLAAEIRAVAQSQQVPAADAAPRPLKGLPEIKPIQYLADGDTAPAIPLIGSAGNGNGSGARGGEGAAAVSGAGPTPTK